MIGLIRLVALHGEHVLLSRDNDLLGLEPGERERNPIVILAGSLYVEGRVIVFLGPTHGLIEHVKEPVETDSRTPERRIVKGPHNHILHEQHGYDSVGHQDRRPSLEPAHRAPEARDASRGTN